MIEILLVSIALKAEFWSDCVQCGLNILFEVSVGQEIQYLFRPLEFCRTLLLVSGSTNNSP